MNPQASSFIPRSIPLHISPIQSRTPPTPSPTALEPFPEYVYQLLLQGASPKRRGHTWSRSCYDSFILYCKEKCGASTDAQRLEFAYFYLWFYFFEDTDLLQWRPGKNNTHLANISWSRISAVISAPSSPTSPVGSTHSSLSDREGRFDILDAQRLCFESEVGAVPYNHNRGVSNEEITQMYLDERPPPIRVPEVWELTEKKEGNACMDLVFANQKHHFDEISVEQVETFECASQLTVLEINTGNEYDEEKAGSVLRLGDGIDTILATINQQFNSSNTASITTEHCIAPAKEEDYEKEGYNNMTYEDSMLSLYSLNRTNSSITDDRVEDADNDSVSEYTTDGESSSDERIKTLFLDYDELMPGF